MSMQLAAPPDWPTELAARGYKEFALEDEARLFQRAFDDEIGRRYFLNFREWRLRDIPVSYDAQICGATSSGGYAWITLKEATIEATEARALRLWEAMGSVYYE